MVNMSDNIPLGLSNRMIKTVKDGFSLGTDKDLLTI